MVPLYKVLYHRSFVPQSHENSAVQLQAGRRKGCQSIASQTFERLSDGGSRKRSREGRHLLLLLHCGCLLLPYCVVFGFSAMDANARGSLHLEGSVAADFVELRPHCEDSIPAPVLRLRDAMTGTDILWGITACFFCDSWCCMMYCSRVGFPRFLDLNSRVFAADGGGIHEERWVASPLACCPFSFEMHGTDTGDAATRRNFDLNAAGQVSSP